jgi:protein SCO1/2
MGTASLPARLAALAIAAAAVLAGAQAHSRVAFSLTTQHGARFTDRDIDGVPLALFFGFTHCPDVCPATLMEMTHDLAELGSAGDLIKVLFVSVDPERDTPDKLAAYMAAFDPRIIALTGPADTIASVARAYGASYRRVDQGTDYTIDHTAAVFLLDRDGEYVGALTFADSEPARLAKLRRLLP